MKRLLLILSLLASCQTPAAQTSALSSPLPDDEDPPLQPDQELELEDEAEPPPFDDAPADSPCPGLEWEECVEWATDRSLRFEERWMQCDAEAHTDELELEAPPPEERGGLSTMMWLAVTAIAAAVAFSAGIAAD